jgi:osmotically-inducible protein OsmY
MIPAVLDDLACTTIEVNPGNCAVPAGGRTASDAAADRAVFEAVVQALRNTGHAALRDLDIEIEGGVVVLWGRVPSYYEKQLAQAAVQQATGTARIANGIEVVCCRYRSPEGH